MLNREIELVVSLPTNQLLNLLTNHLVCLWALKSYKASCVFELLHTQPQQSLLIHQLRSVALLLIIRSRIQRTSVRFGCLKRKTEIICCLQVLLLLWDQVLPVKSKLSPVISVPPGGLVVRGADRMDLRMDLFVTHWVTANCARMNCILWSPESGQLKSV